MVTALQAHVARGDYDAIVRGDDLARVLTRDLRDVCHDLHLAVVYGPREPPPPPGAAARFRAQARRAHYGFGVIERLQGNVARLTIDDFLPVEDVRDGIPALMSQVADADALLLDLRENHGGDPSTVALVASYLFDAPAVHLNDMHWHDERGTEHFCTDADVKGARFGAKKPIYVLTSRATFSGGEELAYDLQSLHRAVIVGETTAGGANPLDEYPLDDWFEVLVPNGRAVNPVTKTNWEHVGVVPDVPVSADAALEEAHRRALQKIALAR
jgi:C-terminal processing protease CtpA/Prc